MGDAPRQFRYLADPACIISLIIYAINRFFLKPHHIGGWFTHGYLNDVLCLPLFVPMILYAQHLMRLRRHYGFPRVWEIFQIWVAFILVFQVVIPRIPQDVYCQQAIRTTSWPTLAGALLRDFIGPFGGSAVGALVGNPKGSGTRLPLRFHVRRFRFIQYRETNR